MEYQIYSVITGTGSYIPSRVVKNEDFMQNKFFSPSGEPVKKDNREIIEKFKEITEIEERRYVEDEYVASDIGTFAAQQALEASGVDPETLDQIIVAHNFGDVSKETLQTDILPSLASKVKYKLRIQNPFCVAYDILFGCPGWIQALIQADFHIKSGAARRVLVIGTETLSRVSDPHDVDSMIYSDGAGAVVLEARESERPVGIISHITRTDTFDNAWLLHMGPSYNPDVEKSKQFLKMNGRKVYEYALQTVPPTVRKVIEDAGIDISDVKKVLIHQANAKMDRAILERLFKLFGLRNVPDYTMPLTISNFGNNSVATVPVLFDLVIKKELQNHRLHSGDHFIFTSVGAGMNINAIVYRMA
ncbi:3-oxoacyl-ACP synthase III family protein [Anaerophaga thermohalophila]|uniref:3-oxoacyl-ACP synthase III family protein n=1 Tax=Anaerophaga thermohalophila TaxID=177400 RepID=UPI000237C8AB|nr:ketoacyl-ACP synthase III [Anaerophaga thermohalophila]